MSALALVFCLAIVLANLSLRFIPVSFNQARCNFPTLFLRRALPCFGSAVICTLATGRFVGAQFAVWSQHGVMVVKL